MSTTEPNANDDSNPDAPATLQDRPVLRTHVWARCMIHDEHAMLVTVGREGSGKSFAALKIGELVDPSFNADRVMFDPADFLERLKDGDTEPGQVYVLDEAGASMGNRTWYDQSQVMLNQALQLIRNENVTVIFTLPRLSELDKQARGRLTSIIEMDEIDEEAQQSWAKWFNINVGRMASDDKIYTKFPRMRKNGKKYKIQRLNFEPPSDELVEQYEQRKQSFQEQFYEQAIQELRGEEAGETSKTPKQIANEIIEAGDLEQYIGVHGGNGTKYVNGDLIQADHPALSASESKQVKAVLEREVDG